jgi:hypothetical protein
MAPEAPREAVRVLRSAGQRVDDRLARSRSFSDCRNGPDRADAALDCRNRRKQASASRGHRVLGGIGAQDLTGRHLLGVAHVGRRHRYRLSG